MSAMERTADIVGCYTVAGKTHFYGVTLDELDRSSFAMVRVLRSFGLAPGGIVLTISLTQEVVQFAPFERAIQSIGLYGINSDLSPYDAGRVESIMRQFGPAAICGVGNETIEGLKMLGHDPAAVFRGRVVWARPDAYDAVAALQGVSARRCALLGPALALECADGGLHVDGQEWIVSELDGVLSIRSRTQRTTPLANLNTGIAGTVPDRPCACGNRDPFVQLG